MSDLYASTDVGSSSAATLNTGNGDNELYPMNQDVTTAADVSFNSVTTTGTNIQTLTPAHRQAQINIYLGISLSFPRSRCLFISLSLSVYIYMVFKKITQ